MADRIIPPSGGDSGERRPTAPRPTGGYGDRPQPPRSTGGYSERPQPPRSGSSYGERSQPSRSTGGSYGARPSSSSTRSYSDRSQPSRSAGGYGERRPAAPRPAGGSGARQSAPRRMNVIRCENCGEDYDVSYKRCPFCDERPGRGGVSGKRVSNTRGGGYGRPVNPIQIAGLVISLALIASALFIVFRFIGAPIFGGKKPPASSQGSSQNTSQSAPNPGSTTGSGSTLPSTPPMVQSIALSNNDVSVDSGATYQMTANLLPAGAIGEVVWTSSDITAAMVDSTGLVTNLNAGNSDVRVTITATCGDVSAQTSVTCKGKSGGGGTAAVGSTGRVINAEKGLNIRSGPGKNYDKVASAQNGATVTILGEENGFYKVKYSGDNIGYVSKDYISVG